MSTQPEANDESNTPKEPIENKSSYFDSESPLVQCANTLIDQLNYGDTLGAMRSINDLVRERDHSIFVEVGKLTRSLHTALRDFKLDGIPNEVGKESPQKLASATDRLNYVISKTESAANKTLDNVEQLSPISHQLGEQAVLLKEEWQRSINADDFSKELSDLFTRVDSFLGETISETQKMDSNISEIVMAQDFQDLTGQVIKKIMKLLRDVEGNLISLVKMASDIESYTGSASREVTLENKEKSNDKRTTFDEGPCVNGQQRDDIMSTQDDVDDLLSSLGF